MNRAQLQTILWLRWRLTRNQWFRGSGFGGALAIFATVCGLMLALGAFLGATAAGVFALRDASDMTILFTWDVIVALFLFLWTIGLLTELQRSESIDLQRLMHLPVALGQAFLINYVASHLSLTLIVAVPAMIGLALGLAFSRGPIFLLLLPLVVGSVFMVTAWTYCLRGWLATLMSNPRRRRTIIMSFTFGIILLGQGPNLYLQMSHRARPRPPKNESKEDRASRLQAERAAQQELYTKLASAQKFVPPCWLPVGAHAVAGGNPWPALAGTAGCLLIGGLGLRRAHRSTVRFYQGEAGRRAVATPRASHATAAPASAKPSRSRLIELRLPGVPEPAAALAGATFRSMLRAPEVKLAWGTSFIVTLMLGGMLFARAAPKLPEAAKPFIGLGTAAFMLFMLMQFVGNQFGFDRDGFRALVLAPTDRRLVLLGKNLANLPVAAVLGLVLIVVSSVWLALPWTVALAAVLQLVSLILPLLVFGNLLSILIPYRVESGTMKPTKMPALAMVAMLLSHLMLPLVMLPAFLPPAAALVWTLLGWPAWVPVNLLLSVLLAALMVLGYWWSLTPLANLFTRREHEILRRVTAGTE